LRASWEYTEDIDNADEQTLEEAIEYCSSEQRGTWLGMEGAIEWRQEVILRAIHGQPIAGGALSSSDMEWQDRLKQLKGEYESRNNNDDVDDDNHDDDNDEREAQTLGCGQSDDEEPDVTMFAGMFRTGMEMLQDAGEFTKEIPDPDKEGNDTESAV
jgi:hypothetical protein